MKDYTSEIVIVNTNIFFQKASIDTPQIKFDPSKGLLYFAGRSYAENVHDVFAGFHKWMKNRDWSKTDEVQVEFRFIFISSASAKVLLDILLFFEELAKDGVAIKVLWYHLADDEDMKETGEEFSEMIHLPFSYHTIEKSLLVPVEDENALQHGETTGL